MKPFYIATVLLAAFAAALLAAGSSGLAATPAAAPITDLREGLVAYWPLDALSETTPDLSGNRNHLQAMNLTAADVVPGKRGNAISFNGVDSLLLCKAANGVGLPANSHPARTVAVWVKGETASVVGRVFSESTNVHSPLVAISTDNRAAKGVVDLYMRADNGNTLVSHHRTSLVAFDDTWHHIAWVDDHGSARLYVDGVLDTNSIAYTHETITATLTALGGVMRDDVVRFAYKGLIDEAAVWSRALSEAEIGSVMANGLDNLPANAPSQSQIQDAGMKPGKRKTAFGDPDKIDVLVVTSGHHFDRDSFFGVFKGCDDIAHVEYQMKDESEVFEDVSDWNHDVIMLYNMTQAISPKRQDNFVRLLKDKGVGLVVVHHAQAAFQSWHEYHRIIGTAYIYFDVEIDGKPWPHGKVHEGLLIPVSVRDDRHPITRGMKDFTIRDETYKGRWWAEGNHVLLATSHPENDEPIAWTRQYGRSRVFNIQLGHDSAAYTCPEYRTLISRGVRWTAETQGVANAGDSVDASPETVTDADGNVYRTVTIGNQVWTVENLRTTKFNDGTPIPQVADPEQWKSIATPGYCHYENDPDNGKRYGVLYNWYAASSDKIAPKGWRVPTHDEQVALLDYLIANGYNCDGTKEGNKVAKSMTATTGWESDPTPGNAGHDLTGNNRSGFSALPTGSRWNDGSFHSIGRSAYWWSATPGSGDDAHLSSIKTGSAQYGFNQHHKRSGFCIRLVRDAVGPDPVSQSAAGIDLKANGAFGFPQDKARVMCDTPELRLSAVNDDRYLFVQAVIWNDHSDELSETEDGRKIGNNSELSVDVDANGKVTPEKDRSYSLNPWPHLPGLHYCILLDEVSSTSLKSDSKGRGCLAYIPVQNGEPVRVDNYLIPLAEIGRKLGDGIRLAFTGENAVKNELAVRFPGQLQKEGQTVKPINEYTLLENGPAIRADEVPDVRRPAAVKETRPAPVVGGDAPEVVAKKWFNWSEKEPPSLKNLRGKVVLVEFWATWCGPCLAGVPHLNELHEKYGKEGLTILSVAEQSPAAIEKYVNSKTMKYIVGAETEAFKVYGVHGIPQAFLIDRNGKIAWTGNPNDKEMEPKLKELLGTGSGGKTAGLGVRERVYASQAAVGQPESGDYDMGRSL